MLTEFISQGFLPEKLGQYTSQSASTPVLPPASHQPKAHLLIFAPPASTKLSQLFLLPNNVTNTNTRKLQRLCSLANLVARHPHRLHTLLLYLHSEALYCQRSLKTSSSPLQNPFPKVTPVPPSLCPSKISRPTTPSPKPTRTPEKPSRRRITSIYAFSSVMDVRL
ncbi:hypothetical protein FVEG_02478 [Fusarium verticillioides 7600]|uniref:Uncharacterized protein n=1 Tax=Gibberella moniliformis (strain M3125 / FGSC 7600) TaxID=334819 RepID=W7LK40_GIBM7|nr:hypothetical protein FVEG_02478 [Fusarium verticillioides 7600]EWG39768.1 hypothetical protein FVEG_02478 [Fusarium verticillioides 7600]